MSAVYGTNLVGELISILDEGGISHNELGVGLDGDDVSGLFYRIRFAHGGRVEIFPDQILLFLGEEFILYAWTAVNGVVEDVKRAVEIINRGKKPGFNGLGTVVEKKEDPVCHEGNAHGSSIRNAQEEGGVPMKTNFERWKETLAPEDFVHISNTWCGNFPFCGTCEADDGRYCHDIFYRWADSPAKEENQNESVRY